MAGRTRVRRGRSVFYGGAGGHDRGGAGFTSTPAPPPTGAYGDQLRTPQERQRMWEAHLRRQEQETREEAEARRLLAEDLQREIARAPTGTLPPPSSPWLNAEETLERLMGHWRH